MDRCIWILQLICQLLKAKFFFWLKIMKMFSFGSDIMKTKSTFKKSQNQLKISHFTQTCTEIWRGTIYVYTVCLHGHVERDFWSFVPCDILISYAYKRSWHVQLFVFSFPSSVVSFCFLPCHLCNMHWCTLFQVERCGLNMEDTVKKKKVMFFTCTLRETTGWHENCAKN